MNRPMLPSLCLYVRTEKLFAGAVVLDDLNETRLQLLDRRDVVRKDTHFTRLGWKVDLNDALRRVDGLLRELAQSVGSEVV